MTRYHIVLSKDIDLDLIEKQALQDERPQHAMNVVRERLGATVHVPASTSRSVIDTSLSRTVGFGPEQWSLGRRLAATLGDDDVVYGAGEDAVTPLLYWAALRRRRPRVTMFLSNIDRPRGRMVLRTLRWRARPSALTTVLQRQMDVAEKLAGRFPTGRALVLDDHTDSEFFRPSDAPSPAGRQIIGSGGLEQRDYRTLAAATAEMDVDVRISASSTVAHRIARSFPDTLPANMEAKFYDWRPLRELYWSSAIVVVPIFPNNYGAGLTTVLEGMACCRPVIVSNTSSIVQELIDSGAVVGVPPSDPAALRAAIERLLADPAEASALAQRGRDLIVARYTMSRYVDGIVDLLRDTASIR